LWVEAWPESCFSHIGRKKSKQHQGITGKWTQSPTTLVTVSRLPSAMPPVNGSA
jgi:hypothetical protein